MEIVGQRLKLLRESVKLSQAKIATLIGTKQTSINRYETNQYSMPLKVLLWYSDSFDVSLDYIFGRTDKPQGNTNIPQLKKQLAETEREIQNVLNAIQQGIFISSTKQRLDELESMKSSLEITLINEEIQKPLITKEQISFWLHRFRKTDVTKYEQRQRLIDSFVNAIYLFDNKMLIVYNYKNSSKTISFDEINGSDLGVSDAPDGVRTQFAFGLFLSDFNARVSGPQQDRKTEQSQKAA